jgi:5,10-methylenetetrahydromethanopterin reductase
MLRDDPVKFGLIDLGRTVESAVTNTRLAEAVGFDVVGIADSQSKFREVYALLGTLAAQTERVRLGPAVTNCVTRHLAVSAAGMATVDEISGGRAFMGIGTGDSALLNLGLAPLRLAGLRDATLALRRLFAGESTEYLGANIHTSWIHRSVPIWISAEGPKTLELAGEIADGVICGMGTTPEIVAKTLSHLQIGAERSGRPLADIDIWLLCRVNVGSTDFTTLAHEIRQELASSAHHAFRFTLEGKNVPAEFLDCVEGVQRNYKPSAHEDLGASHNARLLEDPDFVDYLGSRFGIIGSVSSCVDQINALQASGMHQFLFSGVGVANRVRLIEDLGDKVLPQLAGV